MDVQRQPLADANGVLQSRLPKPSGLKPPSQLRPPSSLKPPSVSAKRMRSPDLEMDQKCQKLDDSTSSNTSVESARSSTGSTKGSSAKPGIVTRKPPAKTGLVNTRVGSTATRGIVKPSIRPAATKPAVTAAKRAPLSRATSTGSLNKKPAPSATKAPATKPTTAAPAGGKKRQPWDLKGRLQDMENILSDNQANNAELRNVLENNNARIAMLESINQQLQGTVQQKELQTKEVSQEVEELQRKLRLNQEEIETSTRKLNREIEDLKFSKSTLERQRETLEGELSAGKQEISGLKSTVAQLTSAQAGLNAELTATKLCLEQAVQAGKLKDEEIASLKKVVAGQQEIIANCNAEMRAHETERRKLHNTIQELKGNIRVFCRVRPLLVDETLGTDGVIPHINFPDTKEQKMLEIEKVGDAALNESTVSARRGGNNCQGKFDFSFDRVFAPDSTQAQVFEEISQLVQSVLDGYNVCIFAYGQTGSGKTHTMEGGSDNAAENRGMIPRAVAQIFQTGRELEEKGWKYTFEASFLEIYNETIRDLLGNGKDDQKYDIKMTGSNSNDVMVTNLTLVPVSSENQVHSLLEKASHNRAVAETKCNERSSRSHSVFRLKLTGSNELTGEGCQGTLNLIDLAGSERLKESGSEGQRLKETQAINKSLSNLGNVIMALANKESHIPYRNSKLTYLLQNSLGGNSKTLMFVNISPKEENIQETLCSLRFATKVNQCSIGTATKKVK
ncbi:carboxy-terminal kinesin 2 [Lingula anatina]|uniref:Kinesin-like protein n=1 Tax=Lingula anatina TaxID=7574 RepID=A0A1S3I404_LINAN|nr:carboxy-terminal kinesin 2 [Lingula anatina]|eukprot:XP_013392997.1 carboxy-terminal kinesin 2 [Lingula anatina]